MRTGVNFVWNPCVHLPIFVEDSRRSDQTSGIENMAGPFWIRFQHGTRLNVDVMLASLGLQALGVFIRNLDGKFLQQLCRGWKHWSGVCEFWKHDEANGKKRCCAGNR